MITNGEITIYHKTLVNHEDVWVRYNYTNAWSFNKEGSKINEGYENANNIDVRIPYKTNDNLNITNFSIEDIIVQGKVEQDITKQQDLSNYKIYNITSINNNNFGTKPHIHLGGK